MNPNLADAMNGGAHNHVTGLHVHPFLIFGIVEPVNVRAMLLHYCCASRQQWIAHGKSVCLVMSPAAVGMEISIVQRHQSSHEMYRE